MRQNMRNLLGAGNTDDGGGAAGHEVIFFVVVILLIGLFVVAFVGHQLGWSDPSAPSKGPCCPPADPDADEELGVGRFRYESTDESKPINAAPVDVNFKIMEEQKTAATKHIDPPPFTPVAHTKKVAGAKDAAGAGEYKSSGDGAGLAIEAKPSKAAGSAAGTPKRAASGNKLAPPSAVKPKTPKDKAGSATGTPKSSFSESPGSKKKAPPPKKSASGSRSKNASPRSKGNDDGAIV